MGNSPKKLNRGEFFLTLTIIMSLIRNKNGEFVVKLGNWTIRGKSQGGKETAIIIEELSIVFDMGYQPEKIEAIQNVLISHGHCDHIGCLHFCHANRKLQNIKLPWMVVMPQCYMAPFKVFATAMSSMGCGGYPKAFAECQFLDEKDSTVTIKPYDKLVIDKFIESEQCKDLPLIHKSNYFVTAHEMKHKITSYGYIITEKRQKLKKEYLSLKGPEIKKLKSEGIEIQETINLPLIAFTGDTNIHAVLDCPDFLMSEILIMECTHFDDTIENAESHGHIHFQQIVENIDKFQNKWIILCHLSQKYRKIEDIAEYLEVLTDEQRKRIIVWI